MSLLASLVRAYELLPNRPPIGFSIEKISLLISLHTNGEIASVSDLRSRNGKGEFYPVPMFVPQPIKRTAAIASNFLWDNTSYALGVTAEGEARAAQKYAAFVQLHEKILAETNDNGLLALLAFLRSWSPKQFKLPQWNDEYKDLNVVFGLSGEPSETAFLHNRDAAQKLVARFMYDSDRPTRVCLVTGKFDTVARLHPSIKGVRGAHGTGAALVSYNLDAFTSYGHVQGDNAQIGEGAAFAYASALNFFLSRGSGHFVQAGDASVVFWAEAKDAQDASHAETHFKDMITEPDREIAELSRRESTKGDHNIIELNQNIKSIARGIANCNSALTQQNEVKFYVVALCPNNGRLSVRLYYESDFGRLGENYEAYCRDIWIEPWPTHLNRPKLSLCASRTDPARRDSTGKVVFNLTPTSSKILTGLLQAVLTGQRFPQSILSTVISRVRHDGVVDIIRISLIKAIIARDQRLSGTVIEDILVRPDPNDTNVARQLGRLFALVERAQRSALGEEIGSTVVDKYLGAATATPGRVLSKLVIAAQTRHIARLKRGRSDSTWIRNSGNPTAIAKKVGYKIEREISDILANLTQGIPSQLTLKEQGMFLIGFYQESWGNIHAKKEALLESKNLIDED